MRGMSEDYNAGFQAARREAHHLVSWTIMTLEERHRPLRTPMQALLDVLAALPLEEPEEEIDESPCCDYCYRFEADCSNDPCDGVLQDRMACGSLELVNDEESRNHP